jgi:dTDP-L-rhamnose 4-epimerase
LADRFLREGWSVRVLDSLQPRVHPYGKPKHLSREAEFIKGDVRNRSDWEMALEGVDCVSHQAAYRDYVPEYSEFSSTNVVGTAMLFEVIAARQLPVRRVVVASSQAVYGEGQFTCPEHGTIFSRSRSIEQLKQAQ